MTKTIKLDAQVAKEFIEKFLPIHLNSVSKTIQVIFRRNIDATYLFIAFSELYNINMMLYFYYLIAIKYYSLNLY